jgi:hypothetical protein
MIAIPAEVAQTIEELAAEDLFATVDRTLTGPVCGDCSDFARAYEPGTVVRHASVDHVRFCWRLREDLAEQTRQEMWAEGAWLRAAEAGTPDTWREEELERMAAASGLPIPPGMF